MASSTIIPSTSTNPNKDALLRESPILSMKMKVAAKVTGIPNATKRALRQPRNRYNTASTRTMPIIALDCRMPRVLLIITEVSAIKAIFAPGGKRCSSYFFLICLISSMIAIELPSGFLTTTMLMAFLPSRRDSVFGFS